MKKFTRILMLLIMTTVAAASLQALPLGAVYNRDSRLYRSLEQLALEAGILMPITTTPVTGHQLQMFFNSIDPQGLDATTMALYDDVALLFSDDSDYTTLDASLLKGTVSLHPEIYLQSSGNEQLTGEDWLYGYKERSPYLSLRAEATIVDSIHGVFSFDMKKNPGYKPDTAPDHQSTSEPFFTKHFQHNIALGQHTWNDRAPFSAFLSFSQPHISVIFGRDTVAWGRGNTGDLIIGGQAPFHDFLQYTIYDKRFAYTFNALFFDDIKEGKADSTSFYDQGKRIFTAKRFEVSFSPRVRAALSSIALYYASGLDLRMFSPLMWEHNFVNQSNDKGVPLGSFNEVNNAMALEIEVAVTPHWGLYGEFFLDQIQHSGEVGGSTSAYEPNAFGFLAGAQFSYPHHSGRLTGFVETVCNTPSLYLKGDPGSPSTDDDTKNNHRMLSNLPFVRSNSGRDESGVGFIGYQYGPDTFVLATGVEYEQPRAYTLKADLEFSIHGVHGLAAHGRKTNHLTEVSSPLEGLLLDAENGALEFRLAGGLEGRKVFSSFLSGFTRVDIMNQWNRRNIPGNHFFDLQLTMGGSLSLQIL